MVGLSWRHVFVSLVIMGVISAGALMWMAFWMTARIEQVERASSVVIVEQSIDALGRALQAGVEDYAHWGLAYDLVLARDDAGLYANLGSGAVESELFDQLFILAPDGALLYAYDGDLGADAHSLYEPDEFAPLLDALDVTEPEDFLSVSGFAPMVLGVSAVTVTRITPDDITQDVPMPVLVGTKQLDQAALTASLMPYQVASASLLQNGSLQELGPDFDSQTIVDFNGSPIAAFGWAIDSSGLALRSEILPLVTAIAVLILIVCGGAGLSLRSQQRRLDHATEVACTDQLTGLLNRSGLADRIQQDPIRRHLKNGHLGAVYLDLNRFKRLNDTSGHIAGDMALRATAKRLQAAVGLSGEVVRLGGDEFLCVVFDVDPERAALDVAERFLDLCQTPIVINGKDHHVSGSVGVAIGTPGAPWETILSRADAAMYLAKQKNADHPVIYRKTMFDTPPDVPNLQKSA